VRLTTVWAATLKSGFLGLNKDFGIATTADELCVEDGVFTSYNSAYHCDVYFASRDHWNVIPRKTTTEDSASRVLETVMCRFVGGGKDVVSAAREGLGIASHADIDIDVTYEVTRNYDLGALVKTIEHRTFNSYGLPFN
jgi:hypothetical protein